MRRAGPTAAIRPSVIVRCSHGAEHRLESATLAAGIESRNPATSGRAVVRVQCSLRLSWGSLQCPPRHGASAVFATIVVGKLAMSAAPRCECSVRYDCRRQPCNVRTPRRECSVPHDYRRQPCNVRTPRRECSVPHDYRRQPCNVRTPRRECSVPHDRRGRRAIRCQPARAPVSPARSRCFPRPRGSDH